MTEKRPGRPARKYCCAAHRKAANQAAQAERRRAEAGAAASTQLESTDSQDGAREPFAVPAGRPLSGAPANGANGATAGGLPANESPTVPGRRPMAVPASPPPPPVVPPAPAPVQPKRNSAYRRLVPEPKRGILARKKHLRRLLATPSVVQTNNGATASAAPPMAPPPVAPPPPAPAPVKSPKPPKPAKQAPPPPKPAKQVPPPPPVKPAKQAPPPPAKPVRATSAPAPARPAPTRPAASTPAPSRPAPSRSSSGGGGGAPPWSPSLPAASSGGESRGSGAGAMAGVGKAVATVVGAIAAGFALVAGLCVSAVRAIGSLAAKAKEIRLPERRPREEYAEPVPRGRRERREIEREFHKTQRVRVGKRAPAPAKFRLPRRRRAARILRPGHYRETLRSALHSLTSNRLRSWLTMIGIVIGVAAVIVLVAMGNGMKAHFNEQFSRLANQITITPTTGSSPGGGAVHQLTDRDVQALEDKSLAPHIVSVSPSVSGTVTLTVGPQQTRSSLIGATENYLELVDRKIVAGRWLEFGRGSGSAERQAVLGQQAIALIWGPGVDLNQVIGSTLRVERTNFKVVGVLEVNGQNDNLVITPFEAARTYLVGGSTGKVDQIVVKSTDVNTVDIAAAQATAILDVRHFIRNAADRDFNVLTFTTLLNKSNEFINFLARFIVAVAAISLVVGGIGVANIMLVSVTERTREIGIRKAVGATRMAILQQFLSEAIILTGLGGIMGMGAGVGITLAADALLPPESNDSSALPHPILSISAVLVAFGVSLLIGVVAGGYPAYRAARLRPIEALRFE